MTWALRTTKEAIAECKVLVTQLELPIPITMEALKLAQSLGVTTILNPSPVSDEEPLPSEFYRLADIFCVNETEAETLSQEKVTDRASAERAALKIIEKGVRRVLVTLGSQGCLLLSSDEESFYVEGELVDHVVDTSGAGDSFLGAFAYYFSLGEPPTHPFRSSDQPPW